MDTIDRIDGVLDWAEEHPTFDTDFVESLKEQYNEKGELTMNQEQALDNIIERFDIGV